MCEGIRGLHSHTYPACVWGFSWTLNVGLVVKYLDLSFYIDLQALYCFSFLYLLEIQGIIRTHLALFSNLLSCLCPWISLLPQPIVCGPLGGEAISLNILNVTAMECRSALGPVDQSSAPLSHPIPSQMLSSQSEISASPEMAPLPQIAFHICVRMSTMCMFNMWPLITVRQSIKAIRAAGAGGRRHVQANNTDA